MGIEPLSEAQHAAATHGGVPDPEPITDDLWSVAVPMPGKLLGYTLSAVHVGPDGAVTIIDPGWETPEVHHRLESSLRLLGRSMTDIRYIVVTHAHADHVGAADALRRRSGAKLLMHAREHEDLDRARSAVAATAAVDATGATDVTDAAGADGVERVVATWGVPSDVRAPLIARLNRMREQVALPDPADTLLRDGDRLPIPGFECEVVPTPGHTPGHMSLVDHERELIFSGDHVLPTIFPGAGLGVGSPFGEEADAENPIAAYLASLERIAPFDGYDVAPGHGYRFRGLESRRGETAAHMRQRAAQVADALAADHHGSVWTIASQLSWTAGWDSLSKSSMLASALLQTGLYIDLARNGD